MTRRALLLLLCAALLLLCALSTRGSLFWLLFWTMLTMLLTGLAAAQWARRTLSVTCALNNTRVTRGAQVNLTIRLRHACPLPVGAVRLTISAASDTGDFTLYVAASPFVTNELEQALPCPHVGEYPAGVSRAAVEDVFGLFLLKLRVDSDQDPLLVLPQIRLTEPLAFSPGDADTESMVSRAFEDETMPTDVRAYQQGDELKKVHWKLSMRRKELLVRVYEQPMRPDALLLVDCAPPDAADGRAAPVRDAICEAAASLAAVALDAGAPVRMPLLGDTQANINAGKPEELPMVLEALGRCRFDGAQEFERVLQLETRRLRRTGSTAIVTSRINPAIADRILHIRRMGPKVRVLLAADASDETVQLLVRRLMRNDVEVMLVSADGE